MGRPPTKRNAIERSALELFVEKGVDAASIRDIAARASVTEGALYRHHRSKDDLVRALFESHSEAFGEVVESIEEQGAPFEATIRILIRTFLAYHDEDPYLFTFLVIVRHHLLDEVREACFDATARLERILARGVENGELPEQDVVLTAQMIIGMVSQLVMAQRQGRVKGPLHQYSERVANACLSLATADTGEMLLPTSPPQQ